jgi:adenine deaminase
MPFPPIFPPTKASLADRIDQGRGVVPADLVLKGGRVFDLVTGDLVETDVAICGDTIVGVFGQYRGSLTRICTSKAHWSRLSSLTAASPRAG